MEKMLRLIHASRLVFAFAFIVSAWRDYDDERTWLVFNLNGEEAAQEYIILGIVMKAKYIIGLGIVMKLYGGISFLSSTCPGALILYVNETLLADNGVRMAMCHHESIDQEEQSQKFCDLINEIERQANSNPLFTQSKFNTFFLPFIKGFGIIAALVFFITIKHKYGMLKKHKTN
ncbi:HR-like lesion-inducing protein-related [Raphanus sativus]|uniref:Uncharacterized protein LOC130495493 n=1 Tax=Raphanus sativus TaxID=3726 RepID=A0A9W3BUP9_RAPSA|nr:uncharacterized protein LOC130495493 [Raphanus sativus]KAJ4887175.1 HR-like lesion-inducing protein-related [Raphanus sativus]